MEPLIALYSKRRISSLSKRLQQSPHWDGRVPVSQLSVRSSSRRLLNPLQAAGRLPLRPLFAISRTSSIGMSEGQS
eukprot:scaffold68346_cov47-Prasinocladus_malaysianus.AAC.4